MIIKILSKAENHTSLDIRACYICKEIKSLGEMIKMPI